MRTAIAESTRDLALYELKAMLEARIREKGCDSFASLHELRGVIDEEFNELREAMHQKQLDQIELELLDLGVAVIFGYACIRSGALP